MVVYVVLPAYNEAKNILGLLERFKQVLTLHDLTHEVFVILVNNGSCDPTADVLEKLLPKYSFIKTVLIEKNQGYGFGILFGLHAAKGEILAWTHADMQTDPQDALRGLDLFEKYGPTIFVKGRRYGRPFADVFFTMGMSLFETLLLRKPLWDINAQPTMFSRVFFETWQADAPHDFALDLYVYYQAYSQHLPIHRFPVKFSLRAHGISHWNINWTAKQKFIKRTIDFSLQLKKRVKK